MAGKGHTYKEIEEAFAPFRQNQFITAIEQKFFLDHFYVIDAEFEKFQVAARTSKDHTSKIDSKENKYTYNLFVGYIPEKFWKANSDLTSYFYYYHKGNFYKVEKGLLNSGDQLHLTWLGTEPPEKVEIVDMSECWRTRHASDRISALIATLNDEMNDYENELNYNYHQDRYTRTVEEEKIVLSDDYYDKSLSVTTEESKKLTSWQTKHNKKYHKSRYSDFELRQGWTSIGDWRECVCTVCEKKAKETNNTNLLKDAVYTMKEIDG